MGLFVRGLNADGLNSLEIVEIRVLFATVLLGICLLVYDKSLLRIRLKDLWCFIGTGVLSITFFNLCYFQTILMTSMAVAAILLYTAPILVVILSAFLFSEKITGRKVIAMVLAFAGCVMVTGIFSQVGPVLSPLGILIGLGAGLGYALYSIFGRYALQRGYHSLTISFYTFAFSLLATVLIEPPAKVFGLILAGNTPKDILLSVGIAVVATILPYILYTLGLTRTENGKASIMASIEPVVASLLGILVFQERLSWFVLTGIALVLGSIVLLNSGK